ncbi:MAG: hypothetical protein ABIP74_00920 [Candidatus Saccharimonas sp.]
MKIRRNITVRFRRALRHMTPAHVVKTRLTKRAIMQFAEKVGLLYFGFVDQRDDEHRLVRGHTVSETHQDNHYCVGSIKGYDVMLVLRNDSIEVPQQDKSEERCHWLIVTVDLHTKNELPHFYIGHHNRDHIFKASFEQLNPLLLGSLHQYSHKFMSDYTIYAKAMHAIEVEQTITPQMSEVIAEHFAGASIEIEDNTLFLYVESQRPSEAVLEKIVSNGLWLAESIDTIHSNKV